MKLKNRAWRSAGILTTGAVAAAVALPGGATAVTGAEAEVGVQLSGDPAVVLPKGDLDDRPFERTAALAAESAAKYGVAVEDLSQRTEDARVFANPDGTWTAEAGSGPGQVQDGPVGEDGLSGWHNIDVALEKSGRSLAPKHAVADVKFSAGDTAWFAKFKQDGHTLTYAFDGPLTGTLPEPIVEGDTVVYHGVFDGTVDDVDLVMQVNSTGFSHWLVLHERPSAAELGLLQGNEDGVLSFPIRIEDSNTANPARIDLAAGGSLKIADAAGKKLFTAPAPLAWDASTIGPEDFDPAGVAVAAREGEELDTPAPDGAANEDDATVVRLDVDVDQPSGVRARAREGSLVSLSVDENFLTGAGTTYPVTVDPSTTVYTGDTWVQTPTYPSSQATSQELKVGTYNGGTDKARSFMNFGTTVWVGKDITSATLVMRNFYSGSCTGGDIRVNRITTPWDSSTLTWSNQPEATTTNRVDVPTAKGYNSSCAAGNVTWDVTKIAQDWAGGANRYGLRMKAVDETSNYTWRRYRSGNYSDNSDHRPHINVTWNDPPNTPVAPTVVGANASGVVADSTPDIKVKASDPDGGNVTIEFQVRQGTTVKSSGTKTVTSNTDATFTSVPLANGAYTVRARAKDPRGLTSAWGPDRAFTVTVTVSPPSSIQISPVSSTWDDDGYLINQILVATPTISAVMSSSDGTQARLVATFKRSDAVAAAITREGTLVANAQRSTLTISAGALPDGYYDVELVARSATNYNSSKEFRYIKISAGSGEDIADVDAPEGADPTMTPYGVNSDHLQSLQAIATAENLPLATVVERDAWKSEFNAVANDLMDSVANFSEFTSADSDKGASVSFVGAAPVDAAQEIEALPGDVEVKTNAVLTVSQGDAITENVTSIISDIIPPETSMAITAEYAQGIVDVSIGVPLDSTVSVSDIAQQAEAGLGGLYGDSWSFRLQYTPQSISEYTSATELMKYQGGVTLGVGYVTHTCTSGFAARLNVSSGAAKYGFITADHCGSGTDDFLKPSHFAPKAGSHLSGRDSITKNRYFGGSGTRKADVMFSQGSEETTNKYYWKVGKTASVAKVGSPGKDAKICWFGRTSKGDRKGNPFCGKVKSPNTTLSGMDKQHYARWLHKNPGATKAQQDAQAKKTPTVTYTNTFSVEDSKKNMMDLGDSGGPAWMKSDMSTAVGLISGSSINCPKSWPWSDPKCSYFFANIKKALSLSPMNDVYIVTTKKK